MASCSKKRKLPYKKQNLPYKKHRDAYRNNFIRHVSSLQNVAKIKNRTKMHMKAVFEVFHHKEN
jgi:hypothetical protein